MIYYKESAHAIMKASKFQDLQSASTEAGKPTVSCKFKSKFESKSREDQCPSTKIDRQREPILPYSDFLFNSGLQQME